MSKDLFVSILKSVGVTEAQMHALHVSFERTAPEDHQKFLEFLTINEAEIAAIRAWSLEG